MSLSVQAHYLGIEWFEQGHARHIEVSPEPIEITVEQDGTLVAETHVFHDLHPWIGLRLIGDLADMQPAFVSLDGCKQPMLRIEDERGGQWWIQNDGWNPTTKRHLSELHRSMGRFTIEIGKLLLQLNNVVNGQTRVEVEEYLRDFQKELIWLALAFGGGTAAAAGGRFANQELVDAIGAFTAAARRVLANPARHVREVQVESRPDRLRPNSATFRQYSRNPIARRFVGRGTTEAANIADNRYVRYLVQVCQKLSASVARSAKSHAQSFAKLAIAERGRGAEYSTLTHRAVDPEIFDRQLEDLKKQLACVASYTELPTDAHHAQEKILTRELEVGKPYASSSTKFFYKVNQHECDEEQIQYAVLEIPKPLAMSIAKMYKTCKYYRLRGVADERKEKNAKGNSYRLLTFTKVFSVEPDTRAVDAKQRKRKQLASNGWLAKLSPQELKEVQQEAHTAKLRARFYQGLSENSQAVSTALAKSRAELRTQDQGWENLDVSPNPAAPMGVRFSQNPDYVACMAAFVRVKRASERAGIGNEDLDAIERISVLHASALYERWCLIKIISVLLVDYQFRPEDHWQGRLIKSVTGRPQSFDLRFVRSDIGLTSVLEVQPTLPNGRRPDFRLRFSYETQDSTAEDSEFDFSEIQRDPHNQSQDLHDGLVLDAKFRTLWKGSELERMLATLVEEKEYGQEGNPVFILHPAPRGVLEPKSPLAWGRDCDYGEDEPHNHKSGHIYLAPGSGIANREGNLRRLIAILLQATFPQPVDSTPKAGFVSRSFCIRCGTRHRPEDVKEYPTKRRPPRPYWVFTCAECGTRTIRTHCYGCSRKLFKNGLHFTYHRTLADQITNVVCPQCGKFFDEDIHSHRDDELPNEDYREPGNDYYAAELRGEIEAANRSR
jgi:pyrethroid hydrolase